MSLLNLILELMQPIPPPPHLEQLSDETRSKIKQAFSSVKCDAYIETHWHFGRVLAIRPQDVNKLRVALDNENLQTDVFANGMIAALKEDKDHFVRFAIEQE